MNNEIDADIRKKYETIGINTKSNHFKRYYSKGLLNNINQEYLEDIENYYAKHLNKTISPLTHLAYANFTGREDVRIIPRNILREVLLPFFNDRGMIDAYADKNSYDILFPEYRQAYTVIKRIRGQYFKNKVEHITKGEAENIILADSQEYILKGSDTANGHGISKIKIVNDIITRNDLQITLDEIEKEYGSNFLIQRVIKQHPTMAKMHPSSVNTLRMVTLRWNNEIHNLYTFARFGVNNDVKDNAQQGGLIVGVNENGSFKDFGVSNYEKVYEHPTTKVNISNLESIPNYELFKETVKDMHRKILYHDYLSWDIVVGEDGKPTFIEVNFFGGAILNQLALERPMFGEWTEEIFKRASKNQPNLKSRNIEIRSDRPLRKRLERLQRKHTSLNKNYSDLKKLHQNLEKQYSQSLENHNKLSKTISEKVKAQNKLEKENRLLKNDIKRIKNSKSWKYTSIFRKKK